MRIHPVLAWLFCLTTMAVGSQSIPLIIKSLQSASTIDEYAAGLKALGITEKAIQQYSAGEFSGVAEQRDTVGDLPLFTKPHFLKAEVLRANLDADSAKEYVSQVIFTTGKEKGDTKVYFIAVHDDDRKGNIPLGTTLFNELLCDRLTLNPMVMSLAKMKGTNRSLIKFDLTRTELCGEQIYFSTQSDSLVWQESGMDYRDGEASDPVKLTR